MLSVVIAVVLVIGVNTVLWGLVGLCRVLYSWGDRRDFDPTPQRLLPDDVAVLIAAHNEERVIAETIRSALRLVPPGNVFVVSDGSVDDTVKIVDECGARVMELTPNRGKAGALAAGIEHFRLDADFQVVLLLDADTRLSADYLVSGLPLFDDPSVVAVAGRAATITDPAPPTRVGRFLIAYRERFYVVVQYLLKFGQAARRANAVSIVPGFASMYRSRVLQSIDICPPRLAIEDFNMTFEIHAKRLGRVAFHPKAAVAYTQDPDSFADYTSQLRRWTLGFWQTVRRHGIHFGRFWGALVLYVFELITSSIMLLLVAPLLAASIAASAWVEVTDNHVGPAAWIAEHLPPLVIILVVVVPDYVLTIFVVIVTRRPRYLLVGIAFPLMRIVDAAICIRTLPEAFLMRPASSSSGIWRSPSRRSSARA